MTAPPLEPFGLGVNRSLYVPRPATERVLERAEALIASGRCLVALTGPAGIGKTMLVRVLVDRLREHASVILLPYPRLSAPELCAWALRLMGEPAGRDPERRVALRAMEERSSGSALVLVIDGAESMLLPAARRLGELARSSEGALRVLAAVTDGSHSGFVLDAFGAELERVELGEPMTAEETHQYVEARLAAARAPDAVRARFDPATLALLHAHSRGIPRRLHELATAVVHGDETPAIEPELPLAPVPRAPAPRLEPDLTGPGAEQDAARAEPAGGDAAPAAEASAPAAGADAPASAPRTVGAPAAAPASIATGAEATKPSATRPEARPPEGKRKRSRPKSSYLEAVGVVALVALAAVAIPLVTPRIAREMAAVAPAPSVSAPREAAPAAALAPPAEASDVPSGPAANGLDAAGAAGAGPAAEAIAGPETPRIQVSVNAVPWAEIEVDGRAVGVTPLAALALAPGPHRFVARLPDGRELVRVVEIGPERRHLVFDADAPADAEPEAETVAVAPTAAALEVSVNAAPWAEIWIDDQPVGITPLAGLPLAPGRHRFRARMPDGRTVEREVEIGPNRRHVSFE